MLSSEPETYRVVVNLEEQYSIWPAGRDLPEGWTEVGVQGSKDDCLDHIERVWTDLRPLSLRRALASDA
ncbi:MbtH family NRPS accessory protein [Streptomyces sp. NPDC001093]|uniref:MbtH family protein n=1 Tax=Streptomyces sp. NPDC001093 TaxID=3154376 RepID=UPI00331FC247